MSVKLVGNLILDIQTFGWKANGTIIQISNALIFAFYSPFLLLFRHFSIDSYILAARDLKAIE